MTQQQNKQYVSFLLFFFSFIYIFMLSFLEFRFVFFFFFKLNKDKQVNLCIWFNGGAVAAHRIERNNEIYTTYITYTIKPKWKPYIEKISLRPPPKIQNAHSFSSFSLRWFWLFSSGRSVRRSQTESPCFSFSCSYFSIEYYANGLVRR